MSKKVLMISTSPRKGGNSDVLADEFARGAREAGNHVEKVALYDQTVGFCKGCLACQSTGRCVIHDDANAIVEKMLTAEKAFFNAGSDVRGAMGKSILPFATKGEVEAFTKEHGGKIVNYSEVNLELLKSLKGH